MTPGEQDSEDTILVPRGWGTAAPVESGMELEDTIVRSRTPDSRKPALEPFAWSRATAQPSPLADPQQAEHPQLQPDQLQPDQLQPAQVQPAPAQPQVPGARSSAPNPPVRAPQVADWVIAAAEPEPHHFRISIAERVIELDAVAYIGRRPSSPRIVDGKMPLLVRVPSPLQEVSSSHLEIRELGASVVVTDLHSTNGSIVVMAGAEPRRMRQGESVVVPPGTLVDLGEGNVIEILPREVPA